MRRRAFLKLLGGAALVPLVGPSHDAQALDNLDDLYVEPGELMTAEKHNRLVGQVHLNARGVEDLVAELGRDMARGIDRTFWTEFHKNRWAL